MDTNTKTWSKSNIYCLVMLQSGFFHRKSGTCCVQWASFFVKYIRILNNSYLLRIYLKHNINRETDIDTVFTIIIYNNVFTYLKLF